MLATIRYRVKPEHLEEHLRLLRSVYEELNSIEPDGIRWATFQLQGEASFIDSRDGPRSAAATASVGDLSGVPGGP